MTRKLQLAYVTAAWPPESVANGVVSYIDAMRCCLADRADVRVLTHRLYGDAVDPSVIDLHTGRIEGERPSLRRRIAWKLHGAAAEERLAAAAIRKAADRLRRNDGLDVVEMEEAMGWACGVIGRVDVPVVVRLHGPWFLNGGLALGVPQDEAYHARLRHEGEAIAAADGVSAPSADVLDRVRRHYGLELPDAEAIPNPIPPAPANARWSVDDCDRYHVVFVGRFDRHKGGDLMIDAFARVHRARPQSRLTCIGPDRGVLDPDTGVETGIEAYMDRAVPDPATRAAIEWTGRLTQPEAAQRRRRASVTVVPSRYETFGYTVGEAMAQGCPIVASNAGAIADMVADGSTGLLAEVENVDDLAEKIIRVLDDPALAANLGRAASVECERRYAPAAVAERADAFYRKTLDRHAQRRHGTPRGHA